MAAQGPSSEGIYETWRTEPGGKYWVIGEAASRSQSGCLSQPQPPRGGQLYRVTSDAQIPAQPHSRNPTRACICEGSPAQVRLGLGAGGFAYRRGCARGGESTESSFIPPCPGWGCSAEEPLPPPVSARFGSSRSRPAVNAVCRRQAPAGRTEIPRCPRLEARRSREMVLGAACPTSALCKRSSLIFSVVLFECHHPRTRGSLLPCRSSTNAGQTLRPCKSGGRCSISGGKRGHHLPTALPGLAVYSQLLFYGFSVWFSNIILPFPVSDSVESGPSLSVIEI